MNALYAVRWTEYERGWGNRPDGYSFHRNADEANQYIEAYWAREKARNPSGRTPDEYSAPGDPFLMEVSESLVRYVTEYGSIRTWQNKAKDYLTYDASDAFARKAEEAEKAEAQMKESLLADTTILFLYKD